MIEIALSKLQMESVENRSEITFLIDMQRSTEINIKVVKVERYVAVIWNPPSIYLLLGMHVEMFQSWEIDDDLRLVVSIGHDEFDVLDVKGGCVICDIVPFNVPGDGVEEEVQLILVLLREVHVCDEIGWEEILHCSFEGVNGVLFHSDSHPWSLHELPASWFKVKGRFVVCFHCMLNSQVSYGQRKQ